MTLDRLYEVMARFGWHPGKAPLGGWTRIPRAVSRVNRCLVHEIQIELGQLDLGGEG